MIYTCTLNPSLDYYMEFDKLELGVINRSNQEYYEPGGKGINVSIVLNNLRIPTRALGFLGGFAKEYFVEMLQQYEYIQPAFTSIHGNTRINIKSLSNTETVLNAKGPTVSEEEKGLMLRRIEKLNSIDVLVLSGSCPDNCFEMADKMMQTCVANQTQIVLDTKPSTMLAFLKYKPLLVKPNLAELEELFNETIFTEEDIVSHAKRIVELGAQNCIVTVGSDGAYLINHEGVFHATAVKGKVISTTGAGDSVVAGFLMNYLRTKDILTIFKYANACGCATALSKGLATREKVEEIVEQVIVTKIG